MQSRSGAKGSPGWGQGRWHCPHAGEHCPLQQADLIGKTLIKLLALTRLLMSSTAGGGGNAPVSLAKGLGGMGQHCMAPAQPGAPVNKEDLIPVPKPEGHPSVRVTPAQLHLHARWGTPALRHLPPV